jgi:hypothetical protein
MELGVRWSVPVYRRTAPSSIIEAGMIDSSQGV